MSRIRLHNKAKNKEVVYYIIGSISMVLYCFCALHLWNYDWSVPFWYRDGDNLLSLLFLKRSADGIWFTDNLGAPFYAMQIDFPLFGDAINFLVRWVLLLLTHENLGLTINFYYIALFPATFCSGFYVLRKLDGNHLFSFMGACLFAALPYRVLRNTAHLDLSNYTFIPFTLLICWNIYTRNSDAKWTKADFLKLCIILLPVALCGIYYAFFACYLIFVTFILRYFKDSYVSKQALASIVTIITFLGIAMLPTLVMKFIYGSNSESPVRWPVDAETYGLKISQFFIPNQGHGISLLEKLLNVYSNAPVPNEGTEYLGIVGAIGLLLCFLLLLGFQKKDVRLQLIGKLNLFAILLGTVGGIGSLFALTISAQIRAYNRISVFCGFFSIAAIVLLLSKGMQKIKRKRLLAVGGMLISLISLVEQTIFQNDQLAICAQDYYSDQAFVQQIEEYASEGAMIYQYPYYQFPETAPMNKMGDYALARGYIHSNSLKWSYGDYKGRSSDLWNRALSEKTIPEQIDTMTIVGFEGIYIDTYAYTQEELNELCSQITEVIGTEDVNFTSENGRLMFYGLHRYKEKLEKKYSGEELEERKTLALLTINYSNGFSGLEGELGASWRWCENTGIINIYNPLEEKISAALSMMVYTGYEEASTLKITTDVQQMEYQVSSNGTEVVLPLTLLSGNNIISFSTDAKQVDAPNDPRTLYFRVTNIKIEEKND